MAQVTEPLPGLEDEPNVPLSYSGFITVNPEKDGHLFFWFFPAMVIIKHMYSTGNPFQKLILFLFKT